MINKIGIDAGGTLIKLAYEEKSRLHVKSFPTGHQDELVKWLSFLAPHATKMITGGKAKEISRLFSSATSAISEFKAIGSGTNYLVQSELKRTMNRFIIVSVGTGTSMLLNENQHYTRISGTGMGGGTFMGLGSILTGESSFGRLVQLAEEGNRLSVDLLVSDIYSQENTSIQGVLTASNFAKAFVDHNIDKKDLMASLVNMIAETLCLLVSNAAIQNKVKDVVFIGGTLDGNAPLKAAITQYQDMLGLQTHFLSLGSYVGAVGALYDESVKE